MAAGMENQIAPPPKTAGITSSVTTGAISELHSAMTADTRPFPKPVKKADTNRVKPNTVQESAMMRMARTVSEKVSAS